MPQIVIALAILIVVFGPSLWVRYVLRRYGVERSDIRGSGSQLARHLLNRFQLDEVGVEKSNQGSHYNLQTRVVHLDPPIHDRKSIAAVAVAAHEVGHAIQDYSGSRLLRLRTLLVRFAQVAQQLGAGLMIAVPIITTLTRIPHTGLLFLVVGLTSLGTAVVIHLVTLPVEIDASFNKALPILKAGQYISASDEKAVRRVLQAAALTYLASSLVTLLNIGRWFTLLRRL